MRTNDLAQRTAQAAEKLAALALENARDGSTVAVLRAQGAAARHEGATHKAGDEIAAVVLVFSGPLSPVMIAELRDLLIVLDAQVNRATPDVRTDWEGRV